MLVLRILIVVAGILPILAGCSKSEVKAGKSDVVELRLKQRTLYRRNRFKNFQRFIPRSFRRLKMDMPEISRTVSSPLQTIFMVYRNGIDLYLKVSLSGSSMNRLSHPIGLKDSAQQKYLMPILSITPMSL